MTAPAPTISAELRTVLRQVKLGRCLDTLPERLALAKGVLGDSRPIRRPMRRARGRV